MIPLLLVFSLLVQLAEAASTNTTSECPAPDATACSYRSVWSILASCGLTVLICTWHAIHPNIVCQETRYTVALYRGGLVLSALLVPELTIARACEEWARNASDYHWTRTHGFFALMGGFVLQDGTQRTKLKRRHDLQWLRNGTIMNLDITKEEIKDRSKSDGLGKAILVIQLFWFILQIVARATNHLAITLLEIDTLAMAALSFLLFFFWWSKPMAPGRPHTFYLMPTLVSQDARETRRFDHTFPIRRQSLPSWWEIGGGSLTDCDISQEYATWAFLIFWIIFGALHLIAWNFQFPSQAEKIIWRVASLTLVVAPCIILPGCKIIGTEYFIDPSGVVFWSMLFIGIVARFALLVVMLASLRDLPASAYETVSWTSYVPHL
ncbi:hypothetical protein PAXINDRAFT_89053 [Paxillus involutus ATCC 200175]|uniref:Integral membrane protein n=1 Tax=Paxillus involutus ATCC 200175 TaxID=664439 RepID=A0A0C9SNP8_PAXIN|nr:hypothetical protein PAXINDRAFT_89053 [Paxillus involutus ATCC 200175]